MKSVNAAVTNALRTSYAVQATPRLTIEWNLNRYFNTTADNTPTEFSAGLDVEMFPIESIYQENRPTRGINKLRVNQGRISDPDTDNQGARYYIGGVDDVYKYWSSPVTTDGSKNFPNHTDAITKCRPRISYDTLVSANKIVINWETTWAMPDVYTVAIQTTVGGAWTVLSGSSFTINSKGQTILYHQGSDVWTTTRPVDGNGKLITNLKTLAGVQVRVNSMKAGQGPNPGTGATSYCDVIEISARREEDFSDRLISVDDTFDIGETSNIYPMGQVTSNMASVTLQNYDGVLSKDSESTYLRWLIEPNAIFNLEYVYDIGGTKYPVQQFKMYGGPWTGQRDDEVTVQLEDFSKFLKIDKPPALFYENLPVTQVIWRLCDVVGFVDYAVQVTDKITQHRIPYFWTDGQQTVWELFDQLSKASQTAIYFDENGLLQIKTREAMFDDTRTIDWYALGQKNSTLDLTPGDPDNQYYISGGDSYVPDIITVDQTDEYEANSVVVNYKATTVSDFNNGFPKLDIVWQPDSTTTLRASPLAQTLSATELTYFWINPNHAIVWPYNGVVQIEGEFVAYNGKNYIYYDAGVRKGANIKSDDEKKKLDAKTFSSQKQLNHFSGAMVIDSTRGSESDPGFPGRGLWSSRRVAHSVDISGYSSRARHPGGVTSANAGSYFHDKGNSVLTIDTGPAFPHWNDLLVVTRGSTLDAGMFYYGTRLKFQPAGKAVQRAGMVIHSGASENGYYFELSPTSKISASRAQGYNELWIYSRINDQVKTLQQVAIPVVEGQWYSLDVTFSFIAPNHKLTTFIDGRAVSVVQVDTGGAWYNAQQGRFGMHVRGQTRASYEYLYSVTHTDSDYPDDSTFWNRVDGAYQGNQWDREWVYQTRRATRKVKGVTQAYQQKYAQEVMDEFGPYCHEVRQMDVKFDPAPVLHSKIYITNDAQLVVPEYNASPFGAKFMLANASRVNAIAHGEDNLSFPGNTVNQVLAVYGRVITQADEAKITAENESQIRRRGRIEVELSSTWIQSESMAQDVADWIKKHWSEAADEQSIQLFGNPVLQLGDVIAVSYKEKAMMPGAPTGAPAGVSGYHKYYVTGIKTTFDEGLQTVVTLRRVRPFS